MRAAADSDVCVDDGGDEEKVVTEGSGSDMAVSGSIRPETWRGLEGIEGKRA